MPRIRRKFAILLSIIVITVIMLMYLVINQSILPTKADNYRLIESKLQALETGFSRHSDEVGKIQRQIDTLRMDGGGGGAPAVADSPIDSGEPRLNRQEMQQEDVINANAVDGASGARRGIIMTASGQQCSIRAPSQPPPNNTVQMLDVYAALPFDNPDGGVWKQGWRLDYDPHQWNAQHKLRVFVVPHSHNDPGWLKTFDEYYEQSTKSILHNMLLQMTENPVQTFIWAEISYFSRWYEQLDAAQRGAVAALVRSGRFEFVTGGWVMADEANSHWLSLLQQLTEGQTWLRTHLNVTPTASWSIDPFGQSATMPLILKLAGLRNLLIQRTHFSVKKRLAQEKQLEFRWRQLWDSTGDTEMFTHMMPFYSYDVPHTCGPDPKICCQFDFKRLAGFGLHCPWNVPPQVIDDKNVAKRSELILDQWRKKSTLYKTRAVLIPLGDDFRYTQTTEWDAQRNNYQRIFDYVNNEPALHVQAKFGTLQEYFAAVHEEMRTDTFPTLSGDFFTYADRDDHYWSGYFTSRPYHKRLDRLLMTYLRSAELLHSWSAWPADTGFDERLRQARRALSLFQHHDGVTGTGRDHVMRDYARRLDAALHDCKHVLQQAAYRQLTSASVYQADPAFTYFHLDDSRVAPAADRLADQRPTIILGPELPTKYVVVHNALPQLRRELVEVLVSKPTVRVTTTDMEMVAAQVAPVWTWHRDSAGTQTPMASTTKYRLIFLARVPPLGLRTYLVHSTATAAESMSWGTTYTQLELFTEQPLLVQLAADYPHVVAVQSRREVSLQAEEGAGASFTVHGMLKAFRTISSDVTVPVHLSFVRYGARKGQERSGAYLFLPDGPATTLPLGINEPMVLVERGPLESRCVSGLPFAVHETVLRAFGPAVEVRNLVDITSMDNVEVVMRLETGIKSGDHFYTDLNGLQMIKRRRFKKLPLQANYYPVPSHMYVEDEALRLTVFSGQPLGGSSLAPGQLEIMQDRRLQFDDNRGLGQGVVDNQPVLNMFRILVENVDACTQQHANHPAGHLTAIGHGELQTLLHPMEKLIWYETVWTGVLPSFGDEREPMDADMQVAVVRNLPHVTGQPRNKDKAKNQKKRDAKGTTTAMGVVLHRAQLRECVRDAHRSGTLNLRRAFGLADDRQIHTSRITLLQRDAPLTGADDIDMCPMDIKAFVISR